MSGWAPVILLLAAGVVLVAVTLLQAGLAAWQGRQPAAVKAPPNPPEPVPPAAAPVHVFIAEPTAIEDGSPPSGGQALADIQSEVARIQSRLAKMIQALQGASATERGDALKASVQLLSIIGEVIKTLVPVGCPGGARTCGGDLTVRHHIESVNEDVMAEIRKAFASIDIDVAAEPPPGLVESLAALRDAVAGIGDQLSGTLEVQVSGEGPGCCMDGQLEEDVRAALRSVNEFLKSGGLNVNHRLRSMHEDMLRSLREIVESLAVRVDVQGGASGGCRVEQLTPIDDFPPEEHEHQKQQCGEVAEQFERDLNKRRLKHLVLVGRADRMPFDDVRYGGNRGLAQARAKWVHDCLRSKPPAAPTGTGAAHVLDVLENRTVLVTGGPLHVPVCTENPNCDEDARRRDRSVDLFACVAEPVGPAAERAAKPSPTAIPTREEP